jgi:peptide/nickel transport system ATP-binding protein
MQPLRGRKVAYVFQDPMTSLNPVKRIGAHFVELIRTHEPKTSAKDAMTRAKKVLENLGILPERIDDYPHQFSGGMRQRIMIGLAIALNPDLVIADEPTTALDVIVQQKTLDLLEGLRKVYGMALILISHDLSIILERCDKIIVLYAGQIFEYANSKELHMAPKHPYTQGLLHSIPNIELSDQKLSAIPGSPPDMLNPPRGCRFWPRCSYAMEICRTKDPELIDLEKSHYVRCFLYDQEGRHSR